MLWLMLTVCLTLVTPPANGQDVDSDETDGHSSRKILGSSVVTSVSVVMETNNGKHTYYTDPVGQPLSKPNIASQVASPINLLNPDRYEFYTFNNDGELVKRLMTLKEIQGIIAGGDSESYNSQMPNPENDVTNVVENVQNVLKEEIEAHKGPLEGKPVLDTPDVSANWNLILPAIFGDTMMNDAVTIDEDYQPLKDDENSDDSATEYMKLSSRTPEGNQNNNIEQNLLSQSSTQMDTTTDHLLGESTQNVATEPKIQDEHIIMASSPSLFSTWFSSTSTKSVPTQEIGQVLTSTESVLGPVSQEIISFTSIKNVEQTITDEPIPVTEKVSESNPTSQQHESTSQFIESTAASTASKTPQLGIDKITTMALVSERTSTPITVTETITNKPPTQTTSDTIELPKVTELVYMITRPTTKEAEDTTSSTTVRTSSVTFPHSSHFVHSTEMLPSSTIKPLTPNEEKIDTTSLTTNEAIITADNHGKISFSTNSEMATENMNFVSLAVTEAAAILNSTERETLEQKASSHFMETNMNDRTSTSTEYGIVADIDQLIANISEEIITKNEKIPIENYNVSEIIQQILNYPTNASEIINQTITLASLIVDSNREPVTTENIMKENTDTTDNSEPDIKTQTTIIPVLIPSSILPITASTTESNSTQNEETVSTTEKLITTLADLTTTTENLKTSVDDSKLIAENFQHAIETLKTTPAILSSTFSVSTPRSSVTTTKLTTSSISKTPPQTVSTANIPILQPTTFKVTTPSTTTSQNTEPNTNAKTEVTEKTVVINRISELSNTPEVIQDKSTISTTQISTSEANYLTDNNTTVYSESSTQKSISEITTVKSTTVKAQSTIPIKIDIQNEGIVTNNDKTTEPPKRSTTLMIKNLTTFSIQPSTVSTTSTSKTRKPVSVSSTTVPSVTKSVNPSTSTTKRKTVQPYSTTTVISIATRKNPITTTINPMTTPVKSIISSDKPITTNDHPETTTGKSITPTRLTNKITSAILNISEPYRRTEDLLPGKGPGDTWKLVQTVQAPHSTTTKKHTTTSLSNNRYSTETPSLEQYQPVIKVDMSTQGTFGMPVLTEDMLMFSKLYNELALKFWNALSVNDISSDRSAVVSPFGAISMLAMVFLGARGGTSGEMNDVLKLDDIVTFNPHLVFKEVTEALITRKSLSAIIRELYTDGYKGKVLEFYKARVRHFYDGHVEEIDFKRISNVIRRRTNALINKQTRGKLPQYLEETTLSLKAPLSALSTNIFQADCSKASTEGRDGELYFIVLPTMRQRRLVPIPAAVWRSGFIAGYDPELDATAVSLGTMNQAISTVFVIPGQQGHSAPGDVLLRLEARLLNTTYIPETWTQLLKSMLPRPGLEIQIPRFLQKSVIKTDNALKRMGLTEMFQASKANLQGINGIAHALYFSDMVQINEFSVCGDSPQVHTEIYPSTTGHLENPNEQMRNFKYVDYSEENDYDIASIPLPLRPRQARLPDVPRLRFDRPFLYFVRHNPTGLILHMGRFNPKLVT